MHKQLFTITHNNKLIIDSQQMHKQLLHYYHNNKLIINSQQMHKQFMSRNLYGISGHQTISKYAEVVDNFHGNFQLNKV